MNVYTLNTIELTASKAGIGFNFKIKSRDLAQSPAILPF